MAMQGVAWRGKHTAAYGPLQFAGHGTAWRGEARRGVANTQRLTGRCSLAWRGGAGQGTARLGIAWRGKHTAAYGPLQFGAVWRGMAGQGTARLGMANTPG